MDSANFPQGIITLIFYMCYYKKIIVKNPVLGGKNYDLSLKKKPRLVGAGLL